MITIHLFWVELFWVVLILSAVAGFFIFIIWALSRILAAAIMRQFEKEIQNDYNHHLNSKKDVESKKK